jgi:hypothetical protein
LVQEFPKVVAAARRVMTMRGFSDGCTNNYGHEVFTTISGNNATLSKLYADSAMGRFR